MTIAINTPSVAGKADNIEVRSKTARLFVAVSDNDLAALERAINDGADIEGLSTYHETALASAARYGHDESIVALLDAGARINRRMVDGIARYGSALHAAVGNGKFSAAVKLLEKGADPRVADSDLNTPGHILVGTKELHKQDSAGVQDLLVRLLKAGLPINQSDKNLQGLLSRAVSANAPPAILKILLDSGADPHQRDNQGKEPIHLITNALHISHLEVLLAAGVDVNTPCAFGRTSLFYCDDADLGTTLLQNGANIAHKCNLGQNVLGHMFSDTFLKMPSHQTLIQLLVEAGGAFDESDYGDRTPMQALEARKLKSAEPIVAWLRAHQARQAMQHTANSARLPKR